MTEWWYLSPINKTAYIPYYINIKKKGMIFMEYNRANAVAYAKKWAYGRNLKYYLIWAVIVQTLRHSAYMPAAVL